MLLLLTRLQSSEAGSCWFYDVSTLGVRLFLVTLLPKIVSAIFFLAALYAHNPSEEDEEEKQAHEEDNNKDLEKEEVRAKDREKEKG